MAAATIPVTVIGGYLGAGKTTLVNSLLAGAHGLRIGVLVNDFGAISIDSRLIAARDGDIVTLANGCACCSVAGDLGEALDRLAAKSSPEHIVIEASGVADPARVAALARSPGLSPRAPVVLADAQTLTERSRDKFVGKLVRRQLAEAGLVVLSKVDLVDADRLTAARALVKREASTAAILESKHANIDVEALLDGPGLVARSILTCDLGGRDADALFVSHSWSSSQPLNRDLAKAAFDALPAGIVRAKGLFVSTGDETFEIHRVGSTTEIARRNMDCEGAAFAFIGRVGCLLPDTLDAAMNACIER